MWQSCNSCWWVFYFSLPENSCHACKLLQLRGFVSKNVSIFWSGRAVSIGNEDRLIKDAILLRKIKVY